MRLARDTSVILLIHDTYNEIYNLFADAVGEPRVYFDEIRFRVSRHDPFFIEVFTKADWEQVYPYDAPQFPSFLYDHRLAR